MNNNIQERLNIVRNVHINMMNEVDGIRREVARETMRTEKLRAERDGLAAALNVQQTKYKNLQDELENSRKLLAEKQAECEALKAENARQQAQLEKADKMLGAVRSAIGADSQQMSFNAPVGQQIAHVDNIIVQQHGNN